MKRKLPDWHTWPPEPYSIKVEGGEARIVDAKGHDVLDDPDGIKRLVECANACAKMWRPEDQIPATLDWAQRTEQLRKDAWAEVEKLRAMS